MTTRTPRHTPERVRAVPATAQTEPAARPLRADARRNRARLVEAARQVLTARGSEASIEQIARAADVGVGTLYRHFPRRIDLVEAVYCEDVDALVTLADGLADDADAWPALETWLRAFVAYAHTKRTFLTELHEAFEKNPSLALDSRRKIRAAAGTVLTHAQATGQARDDVDATDLVQLVAGMCLARDTDEQQSLRLLSVVLDGIRSRRSS